jgi:hypothetical protein
VSDPLIGGTLKKDQLRGRTFETAHLRKRPTHLPRNSAFACPVLRATQADLKNNFTVRTIRLLLQIAPFTIRFVRIRTGFTVMILMTPARFPELFVAPIADGIEARLTFGSQGITPPVQVGHDSIF